jgi:hypothetical protein
MASVNLDELAHAATIVDDGDGSAKALVARDTGMIHLLNDEYMDEEAPLPADLEADGRYVSVPAASALGLGDELVFRFAAGQLAGDQATVRELFRDGDDEGFKRLLEERGAWEAWQRFRIDQTRTQLLRWCEQHGLQAEGAHQI